MDRKVKLVKCIKVTSMWPCAILVFNLVVHAFASSNSKCATLYNSYSHQGSPLSLTDGSKQPNLRHMNFVPQSVKVTPGCFLTIFDIYGNRQTVDRDTNNLGWFPYSILDATCCECGGCTGTAARLDDYMCARLFENERCDSCSGFRLDLKTGDRAKNFGQINKRMTSVAVKQGCTLTVFYEPNYGGWRFNFTHSNNMMGYNWNKQISSAICGCDSNWPIIMPILPTLPTTRPTFTLPTVPTTRPTFTLPTVPTTRPTFTLPTVPTTRPTFTLPTVPTTRPTFTLPTVPTTRPTFTLPTVPPTFPTTQTPITLPTVPTTKPVMTLPTVPTTVEPITLPTVPTTPSTTTTTEDYSYEQWLGSEESSELSESATPTEAPPSSEEESSEWGW